MTVRDGTVSHERVEALALSVFEMTSDGDTVPWDRQPARIRSQTRRSVRHVLAAIELACRSVPSEPVAVKALEWSADDVADTPFGMYRAERTDDGYALTFEHEELVHIGFNAVKPFQSPRNEAMSRAQPDFDQRIRSALTSPASKPEVTEAIVGDAMQDAWDEICSDTGCHPLDIERQGRTLFFRPSHWSRGVALRILAALSVTP